jgi:hypothetical protein
LAAFRVIVGESVEMFAKGVQLEADTLTENLALVSACGGVFIFKARKFASRATSERTTTAHDVSAHHYMFRGLRFNYYSCDYNFSVDGSSYIGLGDCPQEIANDVDSARVLTGVSATVYYDPADPSRNSLLEFSAASENNYRIAMPWIGLGALIILFFVFGRLLAANEKRRDGGVVVDARGTVVFPDEIGFGSRAPGLPDGEAANLAPSPGLRELYLEVANTIHPDRASSEADLSLRERLMKEANLAFERGDAKMLRRVLEEYRGAISAS